MTTTSLPKVPWTQRINFRMVVVFGGLLLLVGFIMKPFLEVALTGGIIDRGEYLEVDLKAMSDFEMDQFEATDADIPKDFLALDGKRVMLVGEMYNATAVGGDLAEFDLVYSIARCCVTSAPKIQHFVKSKVVPGKSVKYDGGLVEVIGTLHVGIIKAEGRVASVYRFDVESARPRL